MIVDILTQNQLLTTYRFYGARHSVIGIGNKINFEIEENAAFLPRLRDLMHIGASWILERNKLYIWQQYATLFYAHLKETTQLDDFYFELLNQSYDKFSKQNPKRVVIESYIKMLEYEGRLFKDKKCYICGEKIGKKVALMRAFLPAHKECIYASTLQSAKIYGLLQSAKTIDLDDDEVEYLYEIVLKGF